MRPQNLRVLVVFAFLGIVSPLSAFRLKTHLWLGHTVLQALRDGEQVEISGKRYSVNQAYRRAVLAHPKAFMAGCMGPDVYPDIVVGQMTTHPGLPGGWKSNDWFRHVLNGQTGDDASLAFALGYLAHGAGDIFAHTYVNSYAGDIFILKDEQEVELRHFALEAFIDRALPRLPGLSDYSNSFEADRSRTMNTLMKARGPLNEYRNPDAFALHIASMVEIQNQVKEMQRFLKSLEDGLANLLSDLERFLRDAKGELASLSGPIANLDRQIQIQQEILDNYLKAIKIQEDIIQEADRIISDTIAELERLASRVQSLRGDLASAIADLAAAAADLARIDQFVYRTIVETIVEHLPWPLNDLVKQVSRVIQETNPVWAAQNAVVRNKQAIKDGIEQALTFNLGDIATKESLKVATAARKATAQIALETLRAQGHIAEEARKALAQLREELRPLKEKEAELLKKAAELQTDIFFFVAVETAKARPLSRLCDMWIRSIDQAMIEYIGASEQSARNVIDSANPVQPYLDWFECWNAAFTGVPKEIIGVKCLAKEEAENLLDRITELRADLVSKLGDAAWVIDPMGKAEMVAREKLVPELKKQGLVLLGQVAGDRTRQIAALLVLGVDDGKMREIFTGSTQKNLIEVPDIVERVSADLGIGANGEFDREKFYPIRNALVLIKMLFVDENGMSEIEKQFNIRSIISPSYPGVDAILSGILSIDGNHQWRRDAPPYIRKGGIQPPDDFYAATNAVNLLYRLVPPYRPNVNALFHGPLIPSLEIPRDGGFSEIRPEQDKYRPSKRNPYPDDSRARWKFQKSPY